MAAPKRTDPMLRALSREQTAAVLAALRAGERAVVPGPPGSARRREWHGQRDQFVEIEWEPGHVQRSELDEAELVGVLQRRPQPFHALLARLAQARCLGALLAGDREASLAELAALAAAGAAEAVWWTWSLAGTGTALDATERARLDAGLCDGTAERAGQWLTAAAVDVETAAAEALFATFLAGLRTLAGRPPRQDRRARRHVGGPSS